MFSTSTVLLAGSLTLSTLSAYAFPFVNSNNGFERGLSPRDLGLRSSSGSTSCGTLGQQTCHNTTTQSNLCCFESPGGLITQVQFWDTNPQTGPDDSWTIHGLWPDHCDGTYSASCDSSRFYSNITQILQQAGDSDLVTYLQEYMTSNDGSAPESFWEHEWNKHGTCYSTLQPSCIPSGSQPGQDAVYFFEQVVSLFKSLPTYTWLANAGIYPTSSQTFTLATLQNALAGSSAYGFTPAFDCSSGELYQIYYYYNLKGSLIDGKFVAIDAPFKGSCPTTGIKYLPKPGNSGSSSTTKSSSPTSTSSASGSSPTGVPSKAFLKATSGTGCLLSGGTWSTQTCATYTVSQNSDSSYNLKTSKGFCTVLSSGAINCASGNSPSSFGAVTSGSNTLLTYSGSSTFSGDSTPSGTTQVTVYSSGSHSVSVSFAFANTS